MNLKNDVEEIWEDLKKYQTGKKIWKNDVEEILDDLKKW